MALILGPLIALLVCLVPSAASAASPTAVIDSVTPSYLEAEVSGTVDPGSDEVFIVVGEVRGAGTKEEWTPTGFAEGVQPNQGPTPVALTIGGLLPGTEYEARIDARVRTSGAEPEHFRSAPTIFTTKATATPTVSIDPPADIAPRSAHFSGTVDPNAPSENPPGYPGIEWTFRCTPSCSGQMTGVISEGYASPHTVEGEATGLEPGTTYKVVLVAAAGGVGRGSPVGESSTAEFTTPDAVPTIEEETSSSITLSEVTLGATIAPSGLPTTYSFAYLPEAAFLSEGWSSTQARATPPAPLGARTGAQPVSSRVTGLAPGTRYVWRVVAANSVGTTVGVNASFSTQAVGSSIFGGCPNESFRLGFGSALPDCRAYEQVSPVNKNGDATNGRMDLMLVSEDGSSATFYTDQGTGVPGGDGGFQDFSPYLSSRHGESWQTQRLMPPVSLGREAGFLDLSQDGRYAFLEATQLGTPGAPGTGRGLFELDTETGVYTQMVPYEANQRQGAELGGGVGTKYAIDGSSADGSVVFFETRASLTGNAAPRVDNLYVWNRTTGAVTLAGVLPDDTVPSDGSFGAAYEWYESPSEGSSPEPYLGGALQGYAVEALHALSPSGSQIYFTAGATGQLYLRRGILGSHPSTVRISQPNPGVSDQAIEEQEEFGEIPPSKAFAAFQEATPSGSTVFFLSSQHLTSDATTGSFDEGKDLYRWDAATETVTDVVPDPTSESGLGAQVVALLGASQDGNTGYFVARGVLPVAPSSAAGVPQEGSLNLYRFSGPSSSPSYEYLGELTGEGAARNWSPRTYQGGRIDAGRARFARVSASGDTLLFASSIVFPGSSVQELYRFEVGEGLHCISCNPTGERPVGGATLQTQNGVLVSGLTSGSTPSVRFSRNLSADGDRVFFESPDPLVAQDTNGNGGCPATNVNAPSVSNRECQDVYEWEAVGTPGGSCAVAEANGGCLYLLSTGQSAQPSFFVGASADGSTAFIATTSKLVPSDTDETYDVYAARIDGGLASQQGAAEGCRGESCLAPPSASPPTASVASSELIGPGNPKPKHHRKKHHKKKKHHRHGKRHGRSGDKAKRHDSNVRKGR